MPMPEKRLRLLLIALPVAACVALALWWALWSVAAARYDKVLNGWVAEGRAQGYDITWASRERFGFPSRVVLRLADLNWRNTDGITFHAGNIDIAARPWQSRSFDVKFKNKGEIAAPLDTDGKSLLLGGTNGAAHVVLDADGVWQQCRVELHEARFGRGPDFLFLAQALTATATRPDKPPKDHHDTGLTLTASGDNIALPPAMPASFGPAMKQAAVAVRIMGAMPDYRSRAAVAAWNNESGVAEFDDLRLDWGDLLLDAKGTVGFDDDLQPEGAFASVIANPEAVLKTLGQQGYIPQGQADMLQSAMGVLAKPANSGGVKGIGVPITVQLGGLFLGPVKVFHFPEIEWEGAQGNPASVSAPAEQPAANP